MPRNCCKCFTVSLVPIAALTLAILFGLAIITLPILYEELTNRTKYGVVIDAGSSHTDLYVYSWDNIPKDTTSSDRITGKLKQISVCSSPVSLNDYVHHPDQAALAFSTCLDDSYREEITPKDERKHTYIYLGATAGMRLVDIANSTISNEILRAVRKKLNGSQYKFTDEQTQAQIIEERVEAASGWVTANYANKAITKSERKKVGSLDLGGASVEIAFEPDPHVNYSSHYHADVNVFDHHYSLYARSYLCYGHNEALGRYRAYLVNQTLNSSQSIVVGDPCLPKGANYSMNTSKIFKRLCVSNSSVAVEAFGYELHPPQWLRGDQNVTFNGTGNATVCDTMIQEVFDFPACNISDTCINGRYFWPVLNNSGGTFMAFSGFYYVANSYNEVQLNALGLDSFRDKVHNVCNSSYSPSRDKKQCFNGAFVLHLLEAGFGFNSSVNDWTIKFTDKVKGVSVGWALGYLMNITSTHSPRPYYTERPYTAVDLIIGIVVLSILFVVFVVFFLLTFHACRKVMKSRSGYTEVA